MWQNRTGSGPVCVAYILPVLLRFLDTKAWILICHWNVLGLWLFTYIQDYLHHSIFKAPLHSTHPRNSTIMNIRLYIKPKTVLRASIKIVHLTTVFTYIIALRMHLSGIHFHCVALSFECVVLLFLFLLSLVKHISYIVTPINPLNFRLFELETLFYPRNPF